MKNQDTDYQESLVVVPISKLNKIVEQSVQKALGKSLPKIIKRASLPTYLDTQSLCELANISPGKCQYLRDQKIIPFVQQGRTVMYSTEKILDYLEKHQITPNREKLEELSSEENL